MRKTFPGQIETRDLIYQGIAVPGQDVIFTALGYGLQHINPVFVESERVRMLGSTAPDPDQHPSLAGSLPPLHPGQENGD
jgi:hypothetical protein